MWEEFIVITGGVMMVAYIILVIGHVTKLRKKILESELRRRRLEIEIQSGYALIQKLKKQVEISESISKY